MEPDRIAILCIRETLFRMPTLLLQTSGLTRSDGGLSHWAVT